MRRLGRGRLLVMLAVIGPGIITAAADNDAGGITTFSVAGARYRYDLLWVVVLTTFLLAIVQEMSARMGVVTQKGLAELIRENFGVKWTMFALGVLVIANLATTVAEFAGLAASLGIFHISKYITLPLAAITIWLLVVKGSFRVVEKVFLASALLYGSYIISGFMARPDWGEVARTAVLPKFHFEADYLFLVIAVIGTNVTPWMQFLLQASVVDKGVRLEHYGYEKLDVVVGAMLTNVVSCFVIVAAAAALYGKPVRDATDAALALKFVAGNYATILFAIGLFNASLLGAAVLPLSTAYTYSEAFGWEIGISRKFKEAPIFYGIYTLMILIGVGVVLVPGLNLINTMVRAQVVSGVLLPIILIFMLKLINRKDVMGNHINSAIYNIIVWASVIFLIVMTVATIVGTVMGCGWLCQN